MTASAMEARRTEIADGVHQITTYHGMTGCMVSITDLADRAPMPLTDGEVLVLGGHRMRWIDTPHTPHSWEAGLLYDEMTGTLFCGDLFTQMGPFAPTTGEDIVGPAIAADQGDGYASWSLAPTSADTVRRLADLDLTTLAPMHAPAFTGDCSAALTDLADNLARHITEA